MTTRDRLLAAAVAVLWGGNFLAIHVGLEHFPPLFMAALRFAVIAVPTLLLVPRPRVPLRWLLGYGLGFGTVQFVFLFVAMDIGMPTGLASLVLQASAPFTVLLGAALLRERMSRAAGDRDRAGGARAGRDRGGPGAVGRRAPGAAHPARRAGLGVRQPGQPAGHAGRRRSGAQPDAPDAVDVGGPAAAAAGHVLGDRGSGRRLGRRCGPRSPRPVCPACSRSATSRCWPPWSAPGSGRR